MKRTLLYIVLLLPFCAIAQGDIGFYLQDIKIIPSDYDAVSKNFSDEKKETLHLVRVYIEAKEADQGEIEDKIDLVEKDRSMNMIDTTTGKQYLGVVDSLNEQDAINNKAKHLLISLGFWAQLFGGEETIGDITPITDKIRKRVTAVIAADEALQKLRVSKKNLGDDINKAQLRIDSLYEKLYDDGKFKIWITGIFSSIVGALLLLFFVFISRKSETNLAKDFLSSGNGLQFITLFSLIIAIILFGVLGVLEGRELAAILSGISGYILGKGITKPQDNTPRNEVAGKAETVESK